MNIALNIAKRYLIARKSTNAINIITLVSIVGVAVITTALLLVLSVFNGFDDLVTSLYDTFNPDIKVIAKEGKTFVVDEQTLEALGKMEGVVAYSKVLEENAMFQYRDKVVIGRLKGVDDAFVNVSQVDTAVFEGEFLLKGEEHNYAVIGRSLRDLLGVNIYNDFANLKVFLPKREGKVKATMPNNSFKQEIIYPKGSFSIQYDYDSKYVFVPIEFAQKMLDYKEEVSAIEIALDSTYNTNRLQGQLKELFGSSYIVKNRYQQDEMLYKVMQTEKWAVYFILTFILLVASFNIIGSLSMIVIEKNRDIGILKAMGATKGMIRRIFILVGSLLGLLGAVIGMVLAVVICLAQQYFKIVRMDGNSFLVDAYPVSMRWEDFVLVFLTVVTITIIASLFPAQRAAEQNQLLQGE